MPNRKVAEGEDIHLKNRVIVVGGGNVAVDVAFSAMRCGANDVTLVCLEGREEMPAHEWEIQGVLVPLRKYNPCFFDEKII